VNRRTPPFAHHEVLGVVSHELRAPLAVISMCARAIEAQAQQQAHLDEAQVRQAMRTIQESAGLMERMIQDLLDVATIHAGKFSLERRPQDVVVILMRAAELFDALAAERSIRLVTDVPDHLPPVSVDAERILQVLANLLGNAIKFTEAGGEVAVRARATPSEVVLSVVDTGPGMPPEHVPHIFDRFWRAREAERASGAGLGLAIAKEIVEAHDGRIWVDSVPGQGSVFHFTLPVLHSTAAAGRPRAAAQGDSLTLPA
jgi:signal transduction histidine kinase